MSSTNLFYRFLIFCSLLAAVAVSANILVYPFDDPVKEARFNHLTQELRCPKCQNNNLADSNSGLALDLKNIIYEQINAGRSDLEIESYLIERYGDFITYRPPLKPSTWLIWFGPFVFLVLGFIIIFRVILVRGKARHSQVSQNVSEASKSLIAEWDAENDSGQKGNKE